METYSLATPMAVGIRSATPTLQTHVPTVFAEAIVHLVRNDSIGTRRLSDFFLSKGISVSAFTTAAEYSAARRNERPACVILDLNLPDIDGLEMQSRLVASAAPPVIFVASQADPVSAVRAMRNGA